MQTLTAQTAATQCVLTRRFQRQWDRLTGPAREAVGRALHKLQRGELPLKSLVAYPGMYEARVMAGMRMIVERGDGPGWIVRSIGPHDPILRRP